MVSRVVERLVLLVGLGQGNALRNSHKVGCVHDICETDVTRSKLDTTIPTSLPPNAPISAETNDVSKASMNMNKMQVGNASVFEFISPYHVCVRIGRSIYHEVSISYDTRIHHENQKKEKKD